MSDVRSSDEAMRLLKRQHENESPGKTERKAKVDLPVISRGMLHSWRGSSLTTLGLLLVTP
jgi:hypothetical protein